MEDIANHPMNLLYRFILELSLLASFFYWGFSQNEGWYQFLYALGLPFLSTIIWATFKAKEPFEKSPLVIVPGYLRLIIELGLFGLGVYLLYLSENIFLSEIFAGFIILHYVISYQRIIWLLKN